MINPLLRTFLTVADCGSFTKASEKLFISATAIMKQMNTLEAQLQLQLIQRSPQWNYFNFSRRDHLSLYPGNAGNGTKSLSRSENG